jgi:signal transduction histidine kinase
LVFGLLAVAATQFAIDSLTRPVIGITNESVTAARLAIATHRNASFTEVERAVVRAASRPGVSIITLQNGGLHNAGLPQELLRVMPDAGLLRRLDLQPAAISIRDGTIIITPEYRLIWPKLLKVVHIAAGVYVLGLLVAWAFARWITSQTLSPLFLVISELERFGTGDFTPRSVSPGKSGEVMRLATAYNAAARQVTAAFEERERVAREIRTLLGDAGHALRTPLTVISGFVDILNDRRVDDRSRERAMRSMCIETRRMRFLVEGLMSLARMEQRDTQSTRPVHVSALSETAIEQACAARGGDVTLLRSSDDLVVADPGELQEAIMNLVENAIKYGAGTPVTVEVLTFGSSVGIRIRDCGPGVPQHERERIFERFFRGEQRPSVEGSGLGLAIVARAMTRCGGTVELENSDGGNTSFLLRLPAARSDVRHKVDLLEANV